MKKNEPVYFHDQDNESKALNEIGNKTTFEPLQKRTKGHDKYLPPRNVYKKRVNAYWHLKNLHYLHKWLEKPVSELAEAQKTAGMPVAEFVIVKFLINTINTSHPNLIKLLMEMSCGGDGKAMADANIEQGGESPTKIVRKILLELPESKRKKGKDV